MSDDHRKPVPQGPGWACFYCDEVFLTQKDAEDHFGLSYYESSEEHDPACVQRLNFSEKALRAAFMDMFRELEKEREAGCELEDEVRRLSSIETEIASLFKGARSVRDAWNLFDSMEGRALAAEAVVAELERSNPELVGSARKIACG